MRHALLLTGLALLITPALAEAQANRPRDVRAGYGRNDADMRNRFGVKLMLGVGGEVEIDGNANVNLPIVGGVRGNVDDDMETSFGLALLFEAPFHQYFTAGGWIAGRSWNHDARDDRNVDRYAMMDLDGFIKVRIPVAAGGMDLEPYALLPLGLSVNFPGDDDDDRVNTGFGWNSGLLLGAVLFVSDNIGLNLEVGYTVHNVTHEVDDTTADFDLSIGQGAFNVGLLVALD